MRWIVRYSQNGIVAQLRPMLIRQIFYTYVGWCITPSLPNISQIPGPIPRGFIPLDHNLKQNSQFEIFLVQNMLNTFAYDFPGISF